MDSSGIESTVGRVSWVPFHIDNISRIPAIPGVYIMRNNERSFGRLKGKSDILYIGSAKKSLRNRVRFYFKPGPSQKTNIRINSMLNKYSIDIAVIPDNDPVQLESKLLIQYFNEHDEQPPFNFQGPQSDTDHTPKQPTEITPVTQKPKRVTIATKIENYLNENPNQCDDCITHELRISSRQVTNQYCRRLEAQGKLSRDKSTCNRCGKLKRINSLCSQNISENRPV